MLNLILIEVHHPIKRFLIKVSHWRGEMFPHLLMLFERLCAHYQAQIIELQPITSTPEEIIFLELENFA